MKRMFALFLVGILLLPSLFACAAEPQATATVPETTPAAPEVPTIEIGESGSSVEGVILQITDHRWTAEEAWFSFTYQSSVFHQGFFPVFLVQQQRGEEWEDFIKYNVPDQYSHTYVCNGDGHHFIGITDAFNLFENGTYRLVAVDLLEGDPDTPKESAETWTEFTVTGMPAAKGKPTELLFSSTKHEKSFIKSPGRSPSVKVIHSAEELQQYCSALDKDSELIEPYDSSYFEEHTLILVTLFASSGSYRFSTDFVRQETNGSLSIGIHTLSPGGLTADINHWTVLIETAAGISVENEADVTLYLDGFINGKFPEEALNF
ncbi:MAG: hypothetical protein IJC84_06625 [Clostridia bacterium]|nr:hypothetical protein [Clostridia bacterium]